MLIFGITFIIIDFLLALLTVLVMIAFFTHFERKLMALLQRRVGPNIAGFWGLLQPVVDGLKALTKEHVLPNDANKFMFVLAPVLAFSFTLSYLALIPFSPNIIISNVNLGVLYFFGISGLSIYPVILSG
jgi:NADH-quinone oxidoreductase subunit H